MGNNCFHICADSGKAYLIERFLEDDRIGRMIQLSDIGGEEALFRVRRLSIRLDLDYLRVKCRDILREAAGGDQN